MIKRKFRILINVAVVCLCLCAIAIGVYSAKTASLNVNGTVGFTAHNCNADIVIKTNGDSINASNERALDGTTVRTTAEVLQSAVKTGSAIGTYANKVEIRGADLTLALKPFYFGDLTDDGSVNNITLSFEITNQSDFSISANVSAVSCDGVAFYNSDGTTAFVSENAEELEIASKNTSGTLTIICKYTGTEDITTLNNLSLSINLFKTVTNTIEFKVGGASFTSIKENTTWNDWILLQGSSSGFSINSNDEVCYNGTPVVTSTNKIVTKTEKITANYTYNLKVEESTITFTFDGTTYSAKKGSTWAEWLETAEAKALGLSVNSSGAVVTSGGDYVNPKIAQPWYPHSIVKGVDLITDGINYYTTIGAPEKT